MSYSKKKYTDAQKAKHYKDLYLGAKPTTTRRVYARAAAKPAYAPRARVARTVKPANIAPRQPGLLSAGGKAAGDLVHPIAGFLGGKLGHLIEQVTGFGDYKVEQNSILQGGMSPPQIVNSVDKGEVIIRHREYIGDITATKEFVNRSYIINPGLASTFPWLSQIANSYEQYRLRGMMFEFNSTSSDALLSSSTSTALGTVMMMTEYDIADEPPTGKRQMLNAEWSCSSKPSLTFIHPIECKKSLSAQSILYSRGGAIPDGFDERLYDFARFNIATEGMQADGGTLGELWVTYEVSFMKQQYSYVGLTDHYRLSSITSARPFGTVVGSNTDNGGTLGGLIAGDALSYAFPSQVSSGQYLWVYNVQGGTATASINAPAPSYTNATPKIYWAGSTGIDTQAYPESPPSPGGTSAAIMMSGVCEVTKQGAYIILSGAGTSTYPTGTLYGDFWITRIADSIKANQ